MDERHEIENFPLVCVDINFVKVVEKSDHDENEKVDQNFHRDSQSQFNHEFGHKFEVRNPKIQSNKLFLIQLRWSQFKNKQVD